MTPAIHSPEPWRTETSPEGRWVEIYSAPKPAVEDVAQASGLANAARIVACVNALAGTEDPEAFIEGLRSTLSHTVDHLRKMLEKVAGSHGIMMKTDQDAARNQARRADALLSKIRAAANPAPAP